MRDAKVHEEEQQLARERAFEDLLEQEFGGRAPVAAILQRAADDAVRGASSSPRNWLVAALIVLGLGVTFALAWHVRGDGDDRDVAGPQDPEGDIDRRWPQDAPRCYNREQLSEAPADTRHLSLSMSLSAARDLSRFEDLEHLEVRLTVRSLVKLVRAGGGTEGRRLEVLTTAPKLRRLALAGFPVGAKDLAVLRRLRHLQVLELSTLLDLNAELQAQMAQGGLALGRPFDREMAEAVVASGAKTLRLSGMPVTVEGIHALADAQLHTLILASADKAHADRSELLDAIGSLPTLQRLELRSFYPAAMAGGPGVTMSTHALTAAGMRRIAALPALGSLTLDQCHLSPEIVAELPRSLRRLDLSSCVNVDESLVGVIAGMPDLLEVGLPLQMLQGRDFMSMLRAPLRAGDGHRRRLTGDDAAEIINGRVWQRLHVDGQLTAAVADALGNQAGLRELFLRPTSGSESMDFVKWLPKLEELTFVETDITRDLLRDCSSCAALRTIAFHDCQREGSAREVEKALRTGIATRWTSHVIWR